MSMPEYDNCDLHWTVDISGYRQLFVDNMVVARMENCIKRLHPFKKVRDRPVIRPEYDWEKYGCFGGKILYDPRDKLFKCWYIPLCTDKTDDFQIPGTCYAQSSDGIEWSKPMFDLFDWKGEKTNLIFKGGFPDKKPGAVVEVFGGIILCDNEPKEDFRFRGMMFRCGCPNEYLERMYGYYAAHSADGIHWKISSEPAISKQRDDPEMSDAFSFMYDSLKNRYICFTKKQRLCPDGVGDQGFIKRIRGISFSDDFIHWTKPQTMLLPDDMDDPDVNLYNIGGFVYEGQYLGLLEIYHSGLEGPKARTTDLQLISSRDGETWWSMGPRRGLYIRQPGDSWCGRRAMVLLQRQ
jgi:hypothetical protein